MTCQCVDVAFGSYDNQVTVHIPPHMKSYEAARAAEGLPETICIDTCILEEIRSLWSEGVVTYGSCCGHGKLGSMVNVSEGSVHIMERLGYDVWHSSLWPTPEDTFALKTGTAQETE